MDTKSVGDIAEQAIILEGLKRGFGVSRPIGDRLSYDLIFDTQGKLLKIQSKSAWFDSKSGNFIVDTRRTQTNRKVYKISPYQPGDFDFAIAYVGALGIFYVFPFKTFVSYKSQIAMVETKKRQRNPRSARFREAWNLLLSGDATDEILLAESVKLGEAYSDGNPEPSQEIGRCRDLMADILT